MTDAYVWLPTFFSYFFSQSFVDSGAIPPFVGKTRGLNEDFSTMSVKIILSTLRNPFSAQHQTLHYDLYLAEYIFHLHKVSFKYNHSFFGCTLYLSFFSFVGRMCARDLPE